MVLSSNKFLGILIIGITLSTSQSFGQIPLHGTSDLRDILGSEEESFEEEGWVSVEDRSSKIEAASKVAQGAYSKKNSVENRLLVVGLGCEVISFSSYDPKTDKSALAGVVCFRVSEGHPQIILGFRGTQSGSDWSVNLSPQKVSASVVGLPGLVHGGFLGRYLETRESVWSILEAVADAHGFNLADVRMIVTGHSMGGALATLAAADIKSTFPQNSDLLLITFASPRVLDVEAAAFMSELMGDSVIRVWRAGDVVSAVSLGTKLIPALGGFKHVGDSVKLGAKGASLLDNHSMKGFLGEASGPQVVTPQLDHRGVLSRLKSFWSR